MQQTRPSSVSCDAWLDVVAFGSGVARPDAGLAAEPNVEAVEKPYFDEGSISETI